MLSQPHVRISKPASAIKESAEQVIPHKEEFAVINLGILEFSLVVPAMSFCDGNYLAQPA